MSFSWVALDGLRKIGIVLTDAQVEGYLHCWQVIGEQLGMREDMVPADAASAEALAFKVMQRQYAACPEGQMMTKALIEMMQHVLPGNVMDALPALYLAFFLGKENAALLGVDEPAAELLQPLSLFGDALTDLGRDKLLADSATKVSQLLINAVVLVARGGARPTFSIPTELKEQWGVNWLS